MLEIQERFSADGYETLRERAGDKLHITEAMDRGEALGYIAYIYEEDKTVIYGLDDGGDLYLCDGLVRSVLFKSCLRDIHTAQFSVEDADICARLEKLGFMKGGCTLLDNIDSLMNGCENCKHNKDNN